MRTLGLLIILFSMCSANVSAQETNRNQFTSAPASSRFELVQSELAAKVTLKVDKFSGIVYQLVQGEKGVTWQIIESEKHPNDTATPGKVNYQVFTSGLAVRMTYLINVNTGATWQLSVDPEIGNFWAVIE